MNELHVINHQTSFRNMYASWQEYLNDFKALCFPKRQYISQHRFSLGQEELQAHWDSYTLTEMEAVFTITDQYTLAFICSHLLPQYLNTRKSLHQAYTVNVIDDNNQEQTLLYIYDSKIFRGNVLSRQENDFISSFLLVYREEHPVCPDSIFQVVSPLNLPVGRWILKVKESCLLRVFGYLRETMHKLLHKNDKIVLWPGHYQSFLHEWMKCYSNYNIQITVSYFFRGVLALLQNQIMYTYLSTLSLEQKEERKYLRPIKLIDKPKNIQQFTLTEGSTKTEIKWQTLKITAFKLKYRMIESANKYQCYMMKEQIIDREDVDPMDQEDLIILEAFSKERKAEEEYSSLYV